jgi:aryl-alcohol dehydrogenase-like predicted oxidoreductase
MKYVPLGRTGISVSRLCFGAMSFGKEADEAMSGRLFNRCIEAGINFFDCANLYSAGRAEEILGRVMQGRRDKLVITSKVGFAMGDGPNDSGLSRRHIFQQLEASLRRLGTDWLDIYFCHTEDHKTPVEETLRAMEDMVRQGKVRHVGISNWPAWKIATALGLAARRGWQPVQVLQPMYSLAKRMAEVELLPLAQAENLGVISYSPLGGGILTGKYLPGKTAPQSRLNVNPMYANRYHDAIYQEIAARFLDYSTRLGVHPVTLAVAWVAANPAITAPILGARNVEQLEPALAAADYQMSAEQWREMAALTPPVPVATDRDEERT